MTSQQTRGRCQLPRSGKPAQTSSWHPLLQRKCSCNASGDAKCKSCEERDRKQIQAKLAVGSTNNAFEREADSVSDRVLDRHADRSGLAPNPVQVRSLSTGAAQPEHAEAPDSVNFLRSATGQPLNEELRDRFERSFGHDFSEVRIHNTAEAARSARDAGALAYTVGRDIVFASHQYAPNTSSGRRLLAHELTHVLQQRGTSSPLAVQRQLAPKRKATILSLDEIAADSSREKQRRRTGQTEAKVCRSIGASASKSNCPTSLTAGTEINVLSEKAGGLWWQIDAHNLPGFGPLEQCYILSVFAKELPITVAPAEPVLPSAPTVSETPATDTLSGRVLKRLSGIPENRRYAGKRGRTRTAINTAIAAMDMWFHEPVDRETAAEVIGRLNKNFVDKYLTDTNFDNKFATMSGLGRTQLRFLFIAGRSALKRLKDLTIPGLGGSEAAWDYEIRALKVAHEVFEVVADDVPIAETTNIKQVDIATGGKAIAAFFSGMLSGLKGQLSDDDYKVLTAKIAQSQALSVVLPQIMLAGAGVGIAKDIKDALVAAYELVTNLQEMVVNMAELISTLIFDEEGARALGEAIGAKHGKDIQKMTSDNIVVFTHKLGEKIGPLVVYTVLAFETGGAVAAAEESGRLARFLKKFPKVENQINRLKKLLPSKKRVPPGTAGGAVESAEEALAAASPKGVKHLPEPKVAQAAGKATRATKSGSLTDVTAETAAMFEKKPRLKRALEKAQRAARALKKCSSLCFPDFVTPSQIDRLERMLETAERSGLVWEEETLTDFLRGGKDWKGFEAGLDEMERQLLRKREVLGEFGEAGRQIGGDRFTPEGRPATTALRAQPGQATGGAKLPDVTDQWFPEVRSPAKSAAIAGTKDVRVAQIPGQIARKLRSMSFKNFDDFRETFWRLVAQDPALKKGWSPQNLARMNDGLAPMVSRVERTGGRANAVYQLNHKQAIKNAGDVYNLDNIEVVTPRFHGAIGD